MGMLVVLFDRADVDGGLGHRQLSRLADVGVTDVSLVGDSTTVGVVLRGWAFDAASSVAEVTEVLGGCPRLLTPVMEAVVLPTPAGATQQEVGTTGAHPDTTRGTT
jgi:hypothetical protein